LSAIIFKFMNIRLLRYIFFAIIFYLAGYCRAQQPFPENYFRPPLDIPMYLSGTFGELRPNHFHAGIDIKTQGVEGKKVYAAADGYVSRIKVTLWGYGNAIYITHPNGYVSVYGHLQRFSKKINSYVRKQQYKRKSYTVDLFPDKELLKVTKGEVIALSGNTGGSMGPHLHFEIRDAGNQHPLNPLLFKSIRIKDNVDPVILELAVYPVDDSSVINDVADTLFLAVQRKNNRYFIDDTLKVSGRVSFGLRAYDRMNGINNKNGIYQEQLYIDSSLVFEVQMKELSFYTSRYINSLTDYRYYQKKKRKLIRTQLDTNNRLAVYRRIEGNGIFAFNDTSVHRLKYVVKDAYGNWAAFRFWVKGYQPDTIIRKPGKIWPEHDSLVFVNYNNKFEMVADGFSVTIPANALYRSQFLNFGKKPGNDDTYTGVFTIGNRFVPLQKYCSVWLKLNKQVPDSLTSKLYVARVDEKNNTNYAGGKFENGRMFFKTRSPGNYTVKIDTVPPVIKPVNVKNGKTVTRQKTLKFIISDKPTGIKKYAAFLNDKWILTEYNPKKALLTYRFDWLMKKGKNHLKLYVFDNRDNETVYEANLIY